MTEANRVVIVVLNGDEAEALLGVLAWFLDENVHPNVHGAYEAVVQAMEDAGLDPNSDREGS